MSVIRLRYFIQGENQVENLSLKICRVYYVKLIFW